MNSFLVKRKSQQAFSKAYNPPAKTPLPSPMEVKSRVNALGYSTLFLLGGAIMAAWLHYQGSSSLPQNTSLVHVPAKINPSVNPSSSFCF